MVQISDTGDPGVSETSDNVFTIYSCGISHLADLNNDCYIDLADLTLTGQVWLECGNPFDPYCGCSGGWTECDGDPNSVCETDINNDVNNCGFCDNICDLLNAQAGCVEGECVVANCNADYGNCDGNDLSGCETYLQSNIDHCGSCDNLCDLPHASESCNGGYCFIDSCEAGWYDCDGSDYNGCERPDDDPYESNDSCSSPHYLGVIDDGAPEQSFTQATIVPTGDEDWFEFYADEGSYTCLPGMDQDYWVRIRLIPPLQGAGCADLDLRLYSDSCSMLASSEHDGCAEEVINYTWDGECGNDDSRYFRIRVVGWQGAWSCNDYELYIVMWQE